MTPQDTISGESGEETRRTAQVQTPGAGDATTARPADTDSRGQESTPIPTDAVFEILKNERRRMTLRYLLRRDEEVKIGELSEHIAAEENDTTPARLSSTERKRAYIGLYQCHLPKMDDYGVVAYNSDRGLIRLGPNVSQVEHLLDQPTTDRPWSQYYLALAAANATLFAGWLAAGVLVADSIARSVTVAVCALAVVSFVALSLVHHHWQPDRATTAH